jgi:hypothetical protein
MNCWETFNNELELFYIFSFVDFGDKSNNDDMFISVMKK